MESPPSFATRFARRSKSTLDMGVNVTIGDGLMEIIGQGTTFFVAWLAFVQINFLYGRRGMAYGT